jgi:transcriptional regulator with XRE-family HTH domain
MDDELKEYMVALGVRIRARRKECNLNMRNIMIATGYYDSQWRKYEGGAAMNLASLLRIAAVLNTTPSLLLEGLPLAALPEVPALHTQPQSPKESRLSEESGN